MIFISDIGDGIGISGSFIDVILVLKFLIITSLTVALLRGNLLHFYFTTDKKYFPIFSCPFFNVPDGSW
jgi:hypothetical protein